jgi:hypothetical protein
LGENKDDKGLLATRLLSRPDAEVFRWWVDRNGDDGTDKAILMIPIERKRVEKKRVVIMLSMRYPMKPVVILCQGGIRIKGAVVEFQVVR